jgi:DNA-binding MarR family transcriptional regulator
MPPYHLARSVLCCHSIAMQQQALSAIVAWVRLDAALQSFNLALRKDYGITGLQLAVLRILGQRPSLPLAALRKALVMHPATLGQSIDELRTMGLCTVARDSRDKRARQVAITDKGRELMSRAPIAGPVRLRAMDHDTQKLDRLKAAFEDAVEMFGLTDYLPGKTDGR